MIIWAAAPQLMAMVSANVSFMPHEPFGVDARMRTNGPLFCSELKAHEDPEFDQIDSSGLAENGVPVPFRPLTQKQIVDMFNAVPVFSIVDGAEQTLATPDERGELDAICSQQP